MRMLLVSVLLSGAATAATSLPPAPLGLPQPFIPAITVPDVISKSPQQIAFEESMPLVVEPGSGIRVEAARCEGKTLIIADHTIQQRSAQEARQIRTGDVLTVRADGSGTMITGDTVLQVNADGSGTLVRNVNDQSYSISVNADGSGEYAGPEGTIIVDGQGGGQWLGAKGVITIRADGGGTWQGEQGVLTIHADGSGDWVTSMPQTNHGDGSGTVGVNQEMVAMAPWIPPPPVAKIDLFKPFTLPGDVCGYLITLDDRVLFDFDQYVLRDDATAALQALAKALALVKAESVEIRGHTDSKGSEDYNLNLSRKRAQAVLEFLQQHAALSRASAHGYGESEPVAPNEVDGKDSPANRQLNRRVEIFVKT